jgi:hypothetical protein
MSGRFFVQSNFAGLQGCGAWLAGQGAEFVFGGGFRPRSGSSMLQTESGHSRVGSERKRQPTGKLGKTHGGLLRDPTLLPTLRVVTKSVGAGEARAHRQLR